MLTPWLAKMSINMNLFRSLLPVVLAVPLLFPLGARAADDWAHSRPLKFDTSTTGGDIKEAVSQLPVLVRLHSGNFTFVDAKPDGSDLRFFAADGKTPLKFHIEQYDATNELAMVWVQMPKLTPASMDDAILVRWGNDQATPAQDAKGTYDPSQVLVLNFSEADGVKDATAQANHARESTAQALPGGPIGAALQFNGTSRVVVPATGSLKLSGTDGFTWSAWVNPAAAGSGTLLAVGPQLRIALEQGTPVMTLAGTTVKASQALKPGVWQHVAVVFGGGKAQFFLDGQPAGDGAATLQEAAGDVVIGEGFTGGLDAVQLARTSRSSAYIQALAVSQQADSPMLTFSDEEAGGEAEVSYMKILLGAVTIDGWVVIAILGVMAVVSLWVMISKTVNLGRTEKANALFLDIFKQKSVHLLSPGHTEVKALASMPAVQASSIYQLYTVGLHEIAQRFDMQKANDAQQQLSGAALESIRAALDATIVRANQKFNSGIVLLTISISGGPFLGLLGTVVGVMITFAAIAAAGDVNVNAIAPGIAAALVATVAGLAVAIPALFAYNWFAIKIKNIAADTQVFADEFLTKSAELHGQ